MTRVKIGPAPPAFCDAPSKRESVRGRKQQLPPTFSPAQCHAIRRGLRPHIYIIEVLGQRGYYWYVDISLQECSCLRGQKGRRCWHLDAAGRLHEWRRQQDRLNHDTSGTPD